MSPLTCPDCGASLVGSQDCESLFHQLLFWESETPELGVVHHLMVLCYFMQHPQRYSAEALTGAKWQLQAFLEGMSPAEMRQALQKRGVASDKRKWKITGTPESYGQYRYPVVWSFTAADVVANGKGEYIESVQKWAQALYTDLAQSENLE